MRWIILNIALLTSTFAFAAAPVDYETDVYPIFQKYCIGCHTEDESQGGFVMESHDQLMKGGDSGNAITQHEPNSSRLLLMVLGKVEPKMPPKDEAQPSEHDIAIIQEWIDQGAVGPSMTSVKRQIRTPKIKPVSQDKTPVTAIALSPNGSFRAIGRFGNVLIENTKGQDVVQIQNLGGKVNSLMFSQDGNRILVGTGVTGAYGQASTFDVATGKLIREIVGHRDTLFAAKFSPDERLIATAGYDRKIILWDASSGNKLRELTGHNGAIFDLDFSSSGKILASACADETVKIWDVATGKRLDTLGQPEGEVFAVEITPDDGFVVAGSADNRLRAWRLLSIDEPKINPIVATRFVDESPLVDLKVTPDGKSVVVLSEDGNLKMIRTTDWNQAHVLDPLPDTGTQIEIDAAKQLVHASLMNGQVVQRELPRKLSQTSIRDDSVQPIYLDLGDLQVIAEADLRKAAGNEKMSRESDVVPVGRGVTINGAITKPAERDAIPVAGKPRRSLGDRRRQSGKEHDRSHRFDLGCGGQSSLEGEVASSPRFILHVPRQEQ